MRSPEPPLILLLALLGALGTAHALAPRPAGPHDGPGDFDGADYWLPRHAEALATRRGAYPVGEAPRHSRATLKFRQLRRISSDLLGPPPASLPMAQAETQTEPYVAVNPEDDDHLVVGWQESRFRDGGARALGVAVSTDGGRRWTDALLPGLALADGGTWNRASDPWPAFGPDGIVYFNSLLVDGNVPGPSAIAVSVSEDGGFTWAPPVEIVRDQVSFNDKNSMVVDAVSQGRHRGNAYVGWDVNVAQNGQLTGIQRMVVARSTDNGRSWQKPKTLIEDDTNIGIVMRVGSDGTVYAIWAGAGASDSNLALRFARSTDGGRRFSRPVKIADYLTLGVPGYRSGAILPSIDIDPVTDDLYVVWPDARFSGVDQAAMIVSRDGGDSWTDPVRVNDGPDQVPAMTVGVTVNRAGDVLVGYYTLRHDAGQGTAVDYYVNRSADGGASFEAGVRVTRKSIDATLAALSGTPGIPFLGDYVGLAGTEDGFVAVITAARKRSALGPGRQPDIFGAVSR